LGEQSSYVNPPFLSSFSIQALLTSSGNQTPGWVLPSRTAKANAAVAKPTDLKNSNIACLDAVEIVYIPYGNFSWRKRIQRKLKSEPDIFPGLNKKKWNGRFPQDDVVNQRKPSFHIVLCFDKCEAS